MAEKSTKAHKGKKTKPGEIVIECVLTTGDRTELKGPDMPSMQDIGRKHCQGLGLKWPEDVVKWEII